MILVGWILAGLSIFLIAYLLDWTNNTMSWYANPWIVLGLYVAPAVGISSCLLFVINHEVRLIFARLNPSVVFKKIFYGNMIIYSFTDSLQTQTIFKII